MLYACTQQVPAVTRCPERVPSCFFLVPLDEWWDTSLGRTPAVTTSHTADEMSQPTWLEGRGCVWWPHCTPQGQDLPPPVHIPSAHMAYVSPLQSMHLHEAALNFKNDISLLYSHGYLYIHTSGCSCTETRQQDSFALVVWNSGDIQNRKGPCHITRHSKC